MAMSLNIKNSKKGAAWIVLCVMILALLPRLYVALASREVIASDAIYYNDRAVSILEGKGFSVQGKPTTFKEPFYSFFLAAIYYLFGQSYMVVRIVQAVLGALSCVIIFLIARRLFDNAAAVISALIASFYPVLIKSAELLFTENLYAFLLILTIFFLLKYIQDGGYQNLALSAFALGIASLTRSVAILMPFFIIAVISKIFVSQGRGTKKIVISAVVLMVFFILPIIPWAVRNWKVNHRFIPVSTTLGIGLYTSYVPKEGKLYGFTAADDVVAKSELLGSEAAQSDFLTEEALKYIKNNPMRVLKLEVLKTAYFWSVFDWEVIGNGVYNFMYAFIAPFFVLGIFANSRRFDELMPLYLPIVYSFIISLVFYGSPRYRLPIEPYIIIIAAAGLVDFMRRFDKKFIPLMLTAGFFFLNLCLYANSYGVKVFVRSAFERIGLW